MKYITILDFNWGRVWKFTYPQEVIDAIINKDNSLDESEAFERFAIRTRHEHTITSKKL